MSFYQIDPPMSTSFWQKDSLISRILFEGCLLWYLVVLVFSLLSNSSHHPLALNCSLFMYNFIQKLFFEWKPFSMAKVELEK